MTPNEKALELFEKFKKAIWKNGNPHHINAHAKQCALICVDEMLGLDVWEWPHNAEYGKLFWMDVKEELLKM